MSDLREKIEEAWWKIAADDKYGLKIMPTPKHHLNLVGDKQKFLDAALEAFKAHIEGCEKPENPYKIRPKHGSESFISTPHRAYNAAIDADRKALMESLEEEKGGIIRKSKRELRLSRCDR